VWDRWDQRVRDTIMFVVGVAGVIHELFIVEEPRAYALLFLGSLIGMPFVLGADKSNQAASDDKKVEETT
jgi:hypothetical protein